MADAQQHAEEGELPAGNAVPTGASPASTSRESATRTSDFVYSEDAFPSLDQARLVPRLSSRAVHGRVQMQSSVPLSRVRLQSSDSMRSERVGQQQNWDSAQFASTQTTPVGHTQNLQTQASAHSSSLVALPVGASELASAIAAMKEQSQAFLQLAQTFQAAIVQSAQPAAAKPSLPNFPRYGTGDTASWKLQIENAIKALDIPAQLLSTGR